MRRYVFLLLCISVFFSCKNNNGKVIVATYNDTVMYLGEVVDAYNNLTIERKNEITDTDEYYRFVRKIALERIILEKAGEAGYYDDVALQKKIDRVKKTIAFDILKEKNVDDKIGVTRDDYKAYRKRYKIYQIVKRTDTLDRNKIDASKALLKKLSNEITDLQSFKESAKQYSDDVTAMDGGYIGKIRLGVMEEEIDAVITRMKVGKVSPVIESSVGLHILYIDEIEEKSYDELLGDKELYEAIFKEKKELREEEWYKKLLESPDIIINEELVKERVFDQKAAASYKDMVITREQLFKTIEGYRKDSFPEPSHADTIRLLKNMVLNVVVEQKSMANSIVESAEYRKRMQDEIDFMVLNNYIDNTIIVESVTDDDIEKFYNENIKKLFTFKLDDGTTYIQPVHEVTKFITQKVKADKTKEARYALYRRLVDDANLDIDNDIVNELINEVKNTYN